MRQLQKLQRCGNSTHVAVPKQALAWLGWLPGEAILFELLENKTVVFRKPTESDFAPKKPRPVVLEAALPMPR